LLDYSFLARFELIRVMIRCCAISYRFATFQSFHLYSCSNCQKSHFEHKQTNKQIYTCYKQTNRLYSR